MTREDFQKDHGKQWAQIVRAPSFQQGMVFLSIQELERIKNLTDEQISTNAVTILSDLRGRLRHEAELMSLPTIEDAVTNDPVSDGKYASQEEEFFQQTQVKP